MKKVIICGAGRMGSAITWAMRELDFKVVVLDSQEAPLRELKSKMSIQGKKVKRSTDIFNTITEEVPDVVISSLPYHQTQEVAIWCIENEIRYCDLGGRVDVSHNINEYAKKLAKKPIMTDLGLAPGWINILAEYGCSQLHGPVDTVQMMVGGIPFSRPVGPLRYFPTWSTDGLLNEYRDECEILEGGEIKKTPGLSKYEIVEPDWEGCVGLEAFCTSGGAAHSLKAMQEQGVKNCVYKTLRWIGHHQLIDFFMNKCEFDDATLKLLIDKSAKYETCHQDVVIMMVNVKNNNGLSWTKENVVVGDHKFSAMQKATAFPISSIAALIGEGKLEGRNQQKRDHWSHFPVTLTYNNIPYNEFEEKLTRLKI